MKTSPTLKPTHAAASALRFRYLRADEVDEVAELWRALHRHHVSVAPHLDGTLGPVDEEESWRRRRAQYVEWLASPDTLAILAERAGQRVGYAMVTIDDGHHGSWRRGERVAVLQTLSVAPTVRGTGVGSALLEEVRRQLATADVTEIELNAVTGNTDAMRFYEQEGFRPFVTRMVAPLGAAAGPLD